MSKTIISKKKLEKNLSQRPFKIQRRRGVATSKTIHLIGPLAINNDHFKKLTRPSHHFIFVDGGANHIASHQWDQWNKRPYCFWVGDGDSLTKNSKAKLLASCFIKKFFPQRKDYSDLKLALDLLTTDLPLNIHLWGFWGGRSDHFLSILGEIHTKLLKHHRWQIKFYDRQVQICLALGQGQKKLSYRGTFSLLCLQKGKIKIIGKVRYPLKAPQVLLPLSSRGLSNVAYGQFSVVTNTPIFLFFNKNLEEK